MFSYYGGKRPVFPLILRKFRHQHAVSVFLTERKVLKKSTMYSADYTQEKQKYLKISFLVHFESLLFSSPHCTAPGSCSQISNKPELGNAQQCISGLLTKTRVPSSPLQTLRTLFYFMFIISQLTTLIVCVLFVCFFWDYIPSDLINKHGNEQKLLR